MLVSLSSSGLDTNKYTNNFAGYQQPWANYDEDKAREKPHIYGYF